MTTGTQQEGQQRRLTWAEWWYAQNHWTKWAPKRPDPPHRLKYPPRPRPYLRLPEERFDLDSFIASLSVEYRGVVQGNQIEWVPAPGEPPVTRWAGRFHYNADEFTVITTAVVRVGAPTPMQRTNDRKIDALRIAEFKGDPPTEAAYLQPLIDGPAHRALARRASRQLEQDAAKHVRQQDDAAIRRFPAKTRLTEEQFATYADILARRWAPPSKKNAPAPSHTEALSNAVLDILSRASYRTKPFPNFEAFAAWLHRWQGNMVRRVGLRVAGLDIDAPGAATPFLTQKQPPVVPVGVAPPEVSHGRLVPHSVIERTEREAARWPQPSDGRCRRWAQIVRTAVTQTMRRHHDGELGVAYSEWHWSWHWEPVAITSVAALPRALIEPYVYTGMLPAETPAARDLIRERDEWAYPDGTAYFHAFEGPIHWGTDRARVKYEQRLTEWSDRRFAYWETAQPEDRYTRSARKNPFGCDRGYAEPTRPIHEAVTDQAAFEAISPEPTRAVVANRIARIERGITVGRRELERVGAAIDELEHTYQNADRRRKAVALALRPTGAAAALTAAERHYATVRGQLGTLMSRWTRVDGALSELTRLRDMLALQKAKNINEST
jgi:hypothetical protein